jgi:hypothetical protein
LAFLAAAVVAPAAVELLLPMDTVHSKSCGNGCRRRRQLAGRRKEEDGGGGVGWAVYPATVI